MVLRFELLQDTVQRTYARYNKGRAGLARRREDSRWHLTEYQYLMKNLIILKNKYNKTSL